MKYKDEIINVKKFSSMGGGVDLAREQRIKQYDLLIAEF